MFQLDARFTSLLSVLFIAVGLFNLYIGRKRMYALRKIGRPAIWYKQTNILTGFEYALLGIVLILNSGISSGFFTDAEGVYVIPIYTGALVLAAIILAFLLFQRVTSNRKRKALPTSPLVEQNTSEPETAQMTPQQRAAQAQRRRERRKNAASARRRQSGKA